MVTHVLEHEFEWPLEKITPLLANEEVLDFKELPNVNSRKQIERRWEGSKLHKVFEWNVHGKIPAPARRIFRPDMLGFTEYSIWDDEEKMFRSKIVPHYLKNIISCESTSEWSPMSDVRTRRKVQLKFECHIPVLGTIVERNVIDYMMKNCDKGAEIMKKTFTKRIGPPIV